MKHCAICQKGSIMAGTRKLLRGHYNPTNWSRKYPNLQKTTLPNGEKVLACAKCIKGLNKPAKKAEAKREVAAAA